MRFVVGWLALIVVLAAHARADADTDDLITRPLVLDREQVEVAVTAEIELAPNRVTLPVAVAPDLWLGVTPRLTVGIVHSNLDLGRIAAGASVCVVEERCAHGYPNSGIDIRYAAHDGPLTVVPRARVLMRDIDPFKPAVALGSLVRWTRGRFMVAADPYLRLGLANRDVGNRAALFVPIDFGVQPARGWLVWLHTGYDSDLAVWHDGYHIPVALGVRARITRQVDVALVGGFASALGPQVSANRRAAFVVLRLRS